jgi:hypothetical protein
MSSKIIVSSVAKSVPFDNATNGFIAQETQSAIEEAKQNAEGFPRAGIILTANGTQSNGDWISYSELTPSAKIVFPVNSRLNEITFSNNTPDVEFALEFYKNGTAIGNLVYTWTVNTSPGVDFSYTSGININFVAGDWIRIKYIDQGDNTSDLNVVLWISRIA